MLIAAAAAGPAGPAIVAGNAETDYAELRRRSLTIAGGLAAGWVEPGERVAIFLHRGADAAAAFFGVLAAGATAVIVNETLRPRQIERILSHSGAVALLTAAGMTRRLPRLVSTRARVFELESLAGATPLAAPRPREDDDVAQIIYTSGSTGMPKGVVVSHGNLWAGMRSVSEYLGITADDRIASLLPFSFDYGLNQLLCAIAAGGCLVVERSPIAARVARTLAAQKVSVLAAVPPLWLQLLETDGFTATPLPALRVMTNSGGKLPVESVRALRRAHPEADLVLMYGLTEAFRSTYLDPERVDRKPDSMGRAIPGAEILLLDDDLAPCPPGQPGQLVHRGPTVAQGYWNDPEASAEVFRPDPLPVPNGSETRRVVFSGDLVYRDEEGDLFFVGRRDGLIKTLGYRVSPDEVIDALHESGEVAEAVVTSEPDRTRGARIIAHVVLTRDGSLERLREFAGRELPRYMQPARFEEHAELPRTASGKYDPKALAHSPR